MLNTLERILKSRIEMYKMFIASRYALGMDASENIHKREECEALLRIVNSAKQREQKDKNNRRIYA